MKKNYKALTRKCLLKKTFISRGWKSSPGGVHLSWCLKGESELIKPELLWAPGKGHGVCKGLEAERITTCFRDGKEANVAGHSKQGKGTNSCQVSYAMQGVWGFFGGGGGQLGVPSKRSRIPFKGFRQSRLPDESSWTRSSGCQLVIMLH